MPQIPVTIDSKELKALQKKLSASPGFIENAVDKQLKKDAVNMVSPARREAPASKNKNAGALKRSIKYEGKRMEHMVTADAGYASYVEYGTSSHTIRPKKHKFLYAVNQRTPDDRWNVWTKANINFWKKVKHPGTKANPFMGRTFKKKIGDPTKYSKKVGREVAKTITKNLK